MISAADSAKISKQAQNTQASLAHGSVMVKFT